MNRIFPLLLLLILTAWSGASAAPAPASAREAIRVLGRDRGAAVTQNILHVFGERGMDQPAVWRVVARDGRGAVREYFISGGAIVSEGVVPPERAYGISPAVIPLSRISVDSRAAFAKAEAAASAAKVGFDSVNYQLRCLELSSNAAWFITYLDERGQRLGEIAIGASTGNVIRATWFKTPQPPPPPAPPPPAAGSGAPEPEGPGLLDRAREGIHRGANGLRNGISNSANWIRRKISRSPQ